MSRDPSIRSVRTSSIAVVGAAAVLAACAPARLATGPAPATESRVVHAASGRDVGLAALADAAARADVVFFGEQHGDPATHRAELALLAAVGARNPNVVVSLEMFERDVQGTLNAYLAGQVPESLFLATARPARRYATDYRALVELARANGWPVVAANVPRPVAAAVSRAGLAALDTLPDRTLAARELSCPRDVYFERFAKQMTSHNDSSRSATRDSAPPPPPMNVERYYESQCVKDETMAESIAGAWRRARGAVVIHYLGSFHSDHGLGTAERLRRRLPDARVLLITAIPVDDVTRADASAWAERADYIIVAPKPPNPPRPPQTP